MARKWATVVKTQQECIRSLYAGLKNWHAHGLRGNLNINTNEKLNLRTEKGLYWKKISGSMFFVSHVSSRICFILGGFSLESAV